MDAKVWKKTDGSFHVEVELSRINITTLLGRLDNAKDGFVTRVCEHDNSPTVNILVRGVEDGPHYRKLSKATESDEEYWGRIMGEQEEENVANVAQAEE